MKKIIFLLFAAIITIQLVLAQNASINVSGLGTSLKTGTDSILGKEIQIPNNLQFLEKLILGVEGPIEFSLLIILAIIWLIAFKLIGEAMKLMPFFEKGIISWIAAVLVMILIALSGGLNFSASFILGFANIFKIFKDWSTGALIFGVIVIIIIGLFISTLEKWIKKKSEIEKANIESTEAGINLGFMGNFRKMLGFGKDISKP